MIFQGLIIILLNGIAIAINITESFIIRSSSVLDSNLTSDSHSASSKHKQSIYISTFYRFSKSYPFLFSVFSPLKNRILRKNPDRAWIRITLFHRSTSMKFFGILSILASILSMSRKNEGVRGARRQKKMWKSSRISTVHVSKGLYIFRNVVNFMNKLSDFKMNRKVATEEGESMERGGEGV